jgi:hypothetical protein
MFLWRKSFEISVCLNDILSDTPAETDCDLARSIAGSNMSYPTNLELGKAWASFIMALPQ